MPMPLPPPDPTYIEQQLNQFSADSITLSAAFNAIGASTIRVVEMGQGLQGTYQPVCDGAAALIAASPNDQDAKNMADRAVRYQANLAALMTRINGVAAISQAVATYGIAAVVATLPKGN